MRAKAGATWGLRSVGGGKAAARRPDPRILADTTRFARGTGTMAINLACGCGKRLKVQDELAGKRARCPGCGDVMTIPNAPVIVAQENRSNPPIRLTQVQ